MARLVVDERAGVSMPNIKGWEVLIIIALLFLLFGAKRLPDAARGLGRSLRIFKSETKGLVDDDGPTSTGSASTGSASTAASSGPPSPTPTTAPPALPAQNPSVPADQAAAPAPQPERTES